MSREVLCPRHGPYDFRLGGCPECLRAGQGQADDKTRVLSGDEGSAPPNRGERRQGGADQATIFAGRGGSAGPAEPAWEPRDPITPARARTPEPPRQAPAADDVEATMVMPRHEAARRGMPLAWLAILEGPGGKPRTVTALNQEAIIGRVHGDVLLSGDPKVSSQHAKVRLEQVTDGQAFVLYDLASANGTFAGSKETYREEASRIYRRQLSDNDYLLLGDTTLVFKIVDG